jgi:hypothetical protein
VKFILAATAAFAAVAIGASAEDTRTLSQFILVCNTSARSCHANLEDYLRAAGRARTGFPQADARGADRIML